MSKFLNTQSSFLIMIDIQEKLLPAIFNQTEILNNSIKLLTAAQTLNVPLIVSRQYPKGIGDTVSELKKLLPENLTPIDKTEFSVCQNEKFSDAFLNLKFDSGSRDTAILFGVESHICVLGTAIDLIEKYNLNVVIAADATGSRTEANHKLALEAAKNFGCMIYPVETIIYQMLGQAGTPEFKKLLPLFK